MPQDRSPAPTAAAGRDLVLVGVVGAPHGVRGEVRLKSFTEDPTAAGDYGPVQTEDGRSFVVTIVRALKDDMVVARIEGVADRDAAAALTHLRLHVPRDRLPPPEEDEFYTSDLVGLVVVDGAGETLGTVTAVVDFGAGDLLELARPAGANVLLPFTKAFVPRVDVAAGRIVAEPPAGLFDDTPDEAGGPDEAATGDPGEDLPRRGRKGAKGRSEPPHASGDAPGDPTEAEKGPTGPAPAAPSPGKGRKGSRW